MNTFLVTIQRKDQVLGREVDKETFTVGRSLECDISLNDNHVSRVHLVISRRWNQVWIEDKNSSNGTFVNGTKIVQGTPVNVVASDKIQIGRSEYVLTIDLKADEIQTPSEPEVELPEEQEEPIEATVAMPAPSFAQPFQAEKALHEAKRKAAQIILEGETQAEKRVQAIYQKARESQSEGEMFYQTRIAEAHKEADAILNDYQQQGRTLIQEARNMAQELREEVDLYVQSLKKKAKADTDDIISEATLAAERLKSEAVTAGRDQALRDSEMTIKNAKDEAERILDFSRLQSQELQERIKNETAELDKLATSLQETQSKLMTATTEFESTLKKDEELKVLVVAEDQRLKELVTTEEARMKAHVESEESRMKTLVDGEETRIKAHVESEEARIRDYVQTEEEKIKTFVAAEKARLEEIYTAEQTKLSELRAGEEKRVADLLAKEESRVNELVSAEASRVKEILDKEQSEVKRLKAEQEDLAQQKVKLDASVAGLTQQQAHLSMDVRDVETKKDHLFKEFESKKIMLGEKLEKEKTQMMKTEEQRLEDMRLEMSKRLQKMERELLDEVLKKKSSMVKEIHSVIEKEVVRIVEPTKWREISEGVEAHILEAIEGKVSTMSQSSVTTEKPVDFLKKRKREQMRWMATGLAMGMGLLFVGQTATQIVRDDLTPMQTAVHNEAKKRQDELEKRRFNPAQTDEVKESYTDAVIYTRNFVNSYTDEEFQQKLYKASSAYLLKTWRVDEDNSIKVIAAANALVKDLADRRANIHPDFVKEGIQKMRDLEKDTLFRMKEILGTEVRVESFRRFEKNFYKEDQQKRKISQH